MTTANAPGDALRNMLASTARVSDMRESVANESGDEPEVAKTGEGEARRVCKRAVRLLGLPGGVHVVCGRSEGEGGVACAG